MHEAAAAPGRAAAAPAGSPVSPAVSPPAAARAFLAFDYGERRVGVAVGNTVLGQAQPLCTLALTGDARFAAIHALLREWRPDALVVGVPFHPDGAEHENTRRARRFARQLHGRFGLPVVEVDERWSTTEAHAQGGREGQGAGLDAHAAAVILEQFLRAGAPDAAA
ncbi:MAG: Holliday junction resolvase RuvX [Rubrivivax sp.]